MKDNMDDELKKVPLAGVGMAATVAEKTKDVVDKYAKKGEKVLNHGLSTAESLKDKMSQIAEKPVNKITNSVDHLKEKTEDALDTMKQKLNDTFKQ